MKSPSASRPFPVTTYQEALRFAWVEIFDDIPILINLTPPLHTGSAADEGFLLGVHVLLWNLGLARYPAGWVVGHISPANELVPVTPPMETVEGGIAALLGMVANTKASGLLYTLDVRATTGSQ